jgi:TusA-related sulfurtransferase
MPEESVDQKPAVNNAVPPSGADLRGMKPPEARARVFQHFFKVKPGQRTSVHVNSIEVEREIAKWIAETGHRLLKQFKTEDNGGSFTTFELIKYEARR